MLKLITPRVSGRIRSPAGVGGHAKLDPGRAEKPVGSHQVLSIQSLADLDSDTL